MEARDQVFINWKKAVIIYKFRIYFSVIYGFTRKSLENFSPFFLKIGLSSELKGHQS